MAMAQLNKAAGINIVGVPYRGSGEAAQAVGGRRNPGRVHVLRAGQAAGRRWQGARARGRGAQRIAGWPDVPTFQELGYKIDFRGFVGLAAPAKTPKPIIEYLNKQLNAVVQSDAFKSRMAALGMTVPADNTPEKYDAYMRAETVRQGELAKLTGQALQK